MRSTVTSFLWLFQLLLAGYHSTAQQTGHSLLWRIQGNDLQKPSYLYGTMHLMDRRVFYFSDSLYHALESSDGFAMEIHPDSMTAIIIGQVRGKIHQQLLKDLLGKEDFDKVDERLHKEFGVSADTLTRRDAFLLKERLMLSDKKADDMPTFVDGYLYGMARDQGKRIAGLEKPEDQEAFLDIAAEKFDPKELEEDNQAAKQYLEKLINVYLDQDLAKINATVNGSTDTPEIRALYKRNRVMVRGMDSLFHTGTFFVAVGAAHLPGDSGLIELLRRQGYSVEPVFSSRKIAPGTYVFKQSPLDSSWVRVSVPREGYEIFMPGNPQDLNAGAGLVMKTYEDLSSGIFYEAGSGPVLIKLNPGNKDSLLEAVVKFISNNGKNTILNKTAYQLGPFDGLKLEAETLVSNGGTVFLKAIFVLTPWRIYIAIIGAGEKETLTNKGSDFFFHSLTVRDPVRKKMSQLLEDTVNHFSVLLPGTDNQEPTLPTSDPNIRAGLHTALDQITGNMVTLTVSSPRPGYFLLPDSMNIYGILKNLKERKGHPVIESRDTVFLNRKAVTFHGIISGSSVRGIIFKRDNYSYSMMALGQNDSSVAITFDSLITSFKFLPPGRANWRMQSVPEGSYRVRIPGVEEKTGDTVNFRQWYDPARLESYFVRYRQMSPYVFASSDTAFLKHLLDEGWNKQTQVCTYSFLRHQGLPGIKFRITEKTRSQVDLGCIYINGERIFMQHAEVFSGREEDPDVNAYFDSLDFTVIAPPEARLVGGKPDRLMRDLRSGDSATRSSAFYFLDSAAFETGNLPELLKAMMAKYPVDTLSYLNIPGGLKRQAMRLLSANTLRLPDSCYFQPDCPEGIRYDLLEMVAAIHTKAAVDTLLGMLASKLPSEGYPYSMLYELEDSLSLAKAAYPVLLKYQEDTLLGPSLFGLGKRLLDSGCLTTGDLQPFERAMQECAYRMIGPPQVNGENDHSWEFSNAAHLLERFRDTGTIYFFRRCLASPSNENKFTAACALLYCGQPLPPGTLRILAADRLYRTVLYDSLKAHHEASLYPPAYLTRQSFAGSYLYKACYDRDDDDDDHENMPVSMVSLKEGIYAFKGKKYKFYLYALRFKDDGNERLGIAGPFDLNGTVLRIDPALDLSGYYNKEKLKRAGVDGQVKAYLDDFITEDTGDELP